MLSHVTKLFSFDSGSLLSDWPEENMVFGDRYWKFEFTPSRFINTLPNHQTCLDFL